MRISIIAAMGKNREIGVDGKLPWHLPDEINFFKAKTLGHHIIMGRKTYESIGRPLPHRSNIVVTNTLEKTEGILIARTLVEAIELARSKNETEVFITGGRKFFEQGIVMAQRMYLTTVVGDFPKADTFFPEFDEGQWQILGSDVHQKDEHHQYKFIIKAFGRNSGVEQY